MGIFSGKDFKPGCGRSVVTLFGVGVALFGFVAGALEYRRVK